VIVGYLMDTLNQDNKAGISYSSEDEELHCMECSGCLHHGRSLHLLDFPQFVNPSNAQRLRYSSLNDVHLVTFPSQPKSNGMSPLLALASSWFLDSSGAIGVRRDQPLNMTGRTSVQL
jgi:hypothetical protein